MMDRIHKRSTAASQWEGKLTPKIRKKLEEIKKKSRHVSTIIAGGDEYEAMDGTYKYVVNLGTRTCGCKYWEISGIPCTHATACIWHNRGDLEDYCDKCYTKEVYLKTYGKWIHPIPDETQWPNKDDEILLPPKLRRLPGRPRKNRRRELDEDVTGSVSRKANTVKCSNCKGFGHNKKSCQRAPVRVKTSMGGGGAGASTSTAIHTQGRGAGGNGRGTGARGAGGRGRGQGRGAGGNGMAGRGTRARGVGGRGRGQGIGRGGRGSRGTRGTTGRGGRAGTGEV